MLDNRTKLQNLLRELFQFDSADLDFGIYRVMNQRRAEIDEFIERGLLKAVADEFELLQADAVADKRATLEQKAKELREKLTPDAIDAQGNVIPLYQQTKFAFEYLQAKTEYEQATVSAEAEADIFNHLYTFLSRYYADGDFISTRRYSQTHKYAIPYNGEEVYLHWANRDQYYVKTADVLTDYAFVVGPHNEYRVRFEIARADTEQGNVKGDNRFFVPIKRDLANYDEASHALTLRFEYRPLTDDEKETYGKTNVQAKIIAASRDRLLKAVPDKTLSGYLSKQPREDDERCLLEIQLHKWTRKSTSDFFVHKDLRGFLNRELDFYIKNEVMRLDNLDDADAPRVESYLTRVKVIKRIARRVIDFLAQIEDFQKRLFEKPKFVLESNWCVTLDRVPPALYPAIAANDKQWEEWNRLFGVSRPVRSPRPDRSSLAFLTAHPFLTIDTALYDAAFKDELLAALSAREGGLAAQTDGLLIHGENFQALALLQVTYRERVDEIYIDPPYNTSDESFVYKNEYKHSSWVCMMEDRVRLAEKFLSQEGVIAVAIDDTESPRLRLLLDNIFKPENRVATLAIEVNPAGQNIRPNVPALSHDYCHIYAGDIDQAQLLLRDLTEEEKSLYAQKDEKGFFLWDNLRRRGGNSRPSDRPNQWYPLYVELKTKKVSLKPFTSAKEVWPIDPQGEKRIWRVSPEGAQREIAAGEISVLEKAGRIEVVKKSRMPEGKKPKTLWKESIYSATSYGTKLLNDIVKGAAFTYPKSVYLVQDCLKFWVDESALVLDFFAGSGTTAHAVINLNREDDGTRKYILIEQGAYFDTVLKPRIRKVIYARDWKDGKPVDGSAGSSHCFQYLRLESYEDTLDNLDLKRPSVPIPTLLPEDRDEYLLKYILDHETREARLNVAAFATPFDYKLRVRRNGVETQVGVDLVETANYLLGLTVTARRALSHQGRTYRVIEGTVGDDSIIVVWRNTVGLDLQKEAQDLSGFVNLTGLDRLYINGDSHVPNATPIETVFVNAMR